MKILIDNRGQTCNKFWSYIGPLSKCIEDGQRYFLLYYDRTIDDYPNLQHNPYFNFIFYSHLINKKIGIDTYMKFIQHFFNNRFYTHETLFKKFPNLFIDGWSQRRNPISEKSKSIIRNIFIPADTIARSVENLFASKREQYEMIIGVHIRRGDYKDWREGRFFYSFERYAEICRQLILKYRKKNIIFFVASNEDIDESVFADIPYFSNTEISTTADLYGLSLCDCIIGPPSSFSRFAAFRGDVGISFIMNDKQSVFDFRKMKNYGYYNTGEQLEFDF